jgi:hypothetical protein
LILNPAIIALISSSLLITAYAVYASTIGFQILGRWDIKSGSEGQLILERKTYLISTLLAYLFGLSLFSLFLFIYTADHVHNLFVGAMCAAGSLNVNKYGYPALVMKSINFFLCGVWLIINYTDNKGLDYPLVQVKYKLLIVITALLAFETFLIINYFLHLQPNVITSCCGTLFSTDAASIAGGIASLPSIPAKVLFYLSVVLALRSGIHFLVTGRAVRVFAYLSTWLYIFSFAAIISFISLYFYELPTHHCPFDLLQRDYNYIGYPLYLSLFAAGITGAGAGVIDRFKDAPSLKSALPGLQKKLCLFAMIGYTVFTLIATYPMIFSDFILEGY